MDGGFGVKKADTFLCIIRLVFHKIFGVRLKFILK